MSDRANPDVENKAGGSVEDDPLAELARIVAGESDAGSGAEVQPSSTAGSELDTQLEQALGSGAEVTQTDSIIQSTGDSGAMTHSMDQHMAELEQAFSAPSSSASSSGESFEDGLISALQSETSPEVSTEVRSVDDELASALTEQFEEPPVLKEEQVPLPESEEISNSAAQFGGEAASIEEDLGAAFDSEFQQMYTDKDPEAGQLDQSPESVSSLEQAMELDSYGQPPHQESEAVVATSETLEVQEESLDFGSAFAEELGLDHLEAEPGWENRDTEAARSEFNRAATGEAGAIAASGVEQPVNLNTSGTVPNSAASDGGLQKGGSLKYALAAMILALFAGTIAAGYGFLGGSDPGSADGEPKLIKAEEGPTKVKPDDPGGRVVANQDKASYDQVQGESRENLDQETLISNTEEPAKIEKPTETDVAALPDVETNLPPKTDERLESAVEQQDDNASQNLGDVRPRVVRTVTVKPDGTIIQNEPEPAPNVVQPETETLSNEVASNSAVESGNVQPDAPASIDGAVSQEIIAIPQASPLPKPVQPIANETVQSVSVAEPEPEPAPAPVAQSEGVVQVSSQRSEEAARASFSNLQNRFSPLQGRTMAIQQANVNGSTFYRVRVQTSSRADANQLCTNLKASGGSCFVTR